MILQFAGNIRNAISSWNTGTNAWLRFLVYERMEKYQNYKTVATFMLSAVWHGFYPGYYLCFVTAALLVSAARSVSRTQKNVGQRSVDTVCFPAALQAHFRYVFYEEGCR